MSGMMDSMCSSMKAVPRSLSMANFSTIVNSILVSDSPVLVCSAMQSLL